MSLSILKMRKDWRRAVRLSKVCEVENGNHDAYLRAQRELNDVLREVLRGPFDELNKKNFVLLCALVSKHRPMEPHAFLTRISMRLEAGWFT